MKYWIVNWNPRTKPIRSSRIFKTFLEIEPPLPFETYGYKDSRTFRSVEKGHVVFCYQKNNNSIVGVCEVENSMPRDVICYPCIVLRRRGKPLKRTISKSNNPILQSLKINRTLTELKHGGEELLEACRIASAA